jgi:hypothetical protein
MINQGEKEFVTKSLKLNQQRIIYRYTISQFKITIKSKLASSKITSRAVASLHSAKKPQTDDDDDDDD